MYFLRCKVPPCPKDDIKTVVRSIDEQGNVTVSVLVPKDILPDSKVNDFSLASLKKAGIDPASLNVDTTMTSSRYSREISAIQSAAALGLDEAPIDGLETL